MRVFLALVALSLSVSVNAADLKADAILCESEGPLQLLGEKWAANQPGSVVMQRAKAHIEYYALQKKADQIIVRGALEERSISWGRAVRNSTDLRMAEANKNTANANTESVAYQDFVRTCTATSVSQPATVLERKPISGAVKVRTRVSGIEADVWTTSNYLTE